MDRWVVLRAAWENAKHEETAWENANLQKYYDSVSLKYSEFKASLSFRYNGGCLKYFHGRRLNLCLPENEHKIDGSGYDAINGEGSFKKVVNGVRSRIRDRLLSECTPGSVDEVDINGLDTGAVLSELWANAKSYPRCLDSHGETLFSVLYIQKKAYRQLMCADGCVSTLFWRRINTCLITPTGRVDASQYDEANGEGAFVEAIERKILKEDTE